MRCNKCGIELNPENWYSAYQKLKKNICKTCERKRAKDRYHLNPSIWIHRSQEYYKMHKTEIRQNQNEENAKIRMEVLTHYGGNPPTCSCCGESIIDFLTIDHLKGGGCKHRKEISGCDSSTSFYRWLWKNHYPEGFQVLCSNCNLGKSKRGICPHKESV